MSTSRPPATVDAHIAAFPLDEPIPYELVGKVVAARLLDNARTRGPGGGAVTR